MKIFDSYTGNAMLNNALMTVEALGLLKSVTNITTEVLLKLYEETQLLSVNKRLKSYTMLFTKNGPLHNDRVNGDAIYESLFKTIIDSFENDGDNICEISGLKFSTQFEVIYEKSLKKINYSEKAIENKDLSIHRGWFPLLGGLGSDAQALPQAKFSIKIHPICVAIMQFLPLSAFLYKGGILLIDSSNFEFTRSFISQNVKTVKGRIQTHKSDEPIENIKDSIKGNYILRAIEILADKNMEDEYSDLNLWSFSNAGTSARCEIERIPNSLIKKLFHMNKNLKIKSELMNILRKRKISYSFLRDLEENKEWNLLYPGVFLVEKKKVKYDGVSVEFLEIYLREIGSEQFIEYAKYLAYLTNKYKSESFNKYLHKTDAYKEDNYKFDLYAVLVKAAENGEWDFEHHIDILDDPELIPIRNNFYNINKLTHFFYLKNYFQTKLPTKIKYNTLAKKICEWIIALIETDERSDSIKKDLLNSQNYYSVKYNNVFLRSAGKEELTLETILYSCYDQKFSNKTGGMNSLLRLYYSQLEQQIILNKNAEKVDNSLHTSKVESWINMMNEFVQNYQDYFFNKYESKVVESKPNKKFINLVRSISSDSSKFLFWFYEAVENTNESLKKSQDLVYDKWSEELLYDPNGEYNITLAKFSIKFLLLKQHYSSFNSVNIQ